MIFDDFITKWTGKPIDFDGAFGYQCMDLMHQYVYEVLGLTDKQILAAPSAYQVYTNFINLVGNNYFNRIANSPTNFPLKGDIIVWGQQLGTNGHIAIVVSADSMKLSSFDQNFPVGSYPHLQPHNYLGCLGWLRVKSITPPDPCKEAIDKLKGEYEAALQDKQEIIDELRGKLNKIKELAIT